MKFGISPLTHFALVSAIFFSYIFATPFSSSASPPQSGVQDLLDEYDAVPCFEDSAFFCITVEVPLDHFNPAEIRSIPVVFAVLPASGERKGIFVTATGGPGSSGVLLADSYSAGFDPSIFESFDVVFFDQRGMGFSGGLTCPYAATEYYQQDGRGVTRKQEQALKKTARTFVADCMDELGSTELLPYLGTRQVVEDLEAFRQLVGDEKFWLYGESYGTQFAQAYATTHGERLAGMILDGTVDLTYGGIDFYAQQAQAFNDTLVASLSACNEDPACAAQMNGDAIAAYDALAAKLRKSPISFKFPLPNGRFQSRKFTLTDFEYVASTQMYGESDRMMFTRALGAYTSNGNIVPLARLLYIDLVVDPHTLEVIPDDSWSDAIYYGVQCQDYGYPGTTPNQRAELYLDAADPFEASIPRLASIIYGDLPCTYWPSASSDLTLPGYLFADGVPTLVLGATADPATPVSHGINVYQHLADGYLITTEGGPHVTFGYGNECPDALVTDFLVNDIVPAQRETVCEGYLADEYVSNAPRHARFLQDLSDALSAAETEVYYLPEFYYWDGYTPTTVGCTYGGTLYFESDELGTTYNMEFGRCELIANFVLTGSGFHDTENDRMQADIKTAGRWSCTLHYERDGDQIDLSGKCDGKPLHIEESDENSE